MSQKRDKMDLQRLKALTVLVKSAIKRQETEAFEIRYYVKIPLT